MKNSSYDCVLSGWSSSLEASYSTFFITFLSCLARIFRSAFSSFFLSTLDSTFRALVASRSTPPLVNPNVEDTFLCELTWMACSNFLAAKGICRLSPSTPSARLSLEMNFSTKLRIEVSFCLSKFPDAETSNVVIVSNASAIGDWADASSSEKYNFEA